VRDDAEVNAMLAVSTIKGGIRVGGRKPTDVSPAAAATPKQTDEREPALAAPKG
jgi:geranylgeranyl reductase